MVCRKGTLGLGPNIAVGLLDVSETGVRLLVKVALPKGQEVEVSLLPPGHAREFRLTGQVVWSQETTDGHHCVGIHFDKLLSYVAFCDLGKL